MAFRIIGGLKVLIQITKSGS